jgi:hypothetical protein
VNHSVCHRHRRDALGIIANLAPDIGAPGPHDFAVRERAARRNGISASTAFQPASVTIAIRPSILD